MVGTNPSRWPSRRRARDQRALPLIVVQSFKDGGCWRGLSQKKVPTLPRRARPGEFRRQFPCCGEWQRYLERNFSRCFPRRRRRDRKASKRRAGRREREATPRA